MAINQLLPFGTGAGANVLSQASYSALAARLTGFQAGTANSPELNKAWRQASFAAAMIGQFTADGSKKDVLDDGDVAVFQANFEAAIRAQGAVSYEGFFISTAITKTVYGVGADFADLAAAFLWLSYRRILSTGSVTLSLPAGNHALPTSPIVLDHPDGQRINIEGAALTGGGAPVVSDFQITGVNSGARATDTAAHLTMLQGRFPTRLTGSSGSGIRLGRIGLVSRILTQGVGGAGAVAALTITGQGQLQNVAIQGAPNLGLQVTGKVELVGNVYVTGSGASHGVSASAGGQMFGAGALQTYSSALDGINMGQNASLAVGAVTTRGNGLSGISLLEGSTFGCQAGSSFSNNGQDGVQVDKSAAHIRNSTISSNTRDGVRATMGGVVQTDFTTFSGNGVNPCYASDMSIITNFNNTGIGAGTCSPVVNGGVGNRNSLISAV